MISEDVELQDGASVFACVSVVTGCTSDKSTKAMGFVFALGDTEERSDVTLCRGEAGNGEERSALGDSASDSMFLMTQVVGCSAS